MDKLRYIVASNKGMRFRDSQFYVYDSLTHQPYEKDIRKGWYNTKKQCQKACDKLNRQGKNA